MKIQQPHQAQQVRRQSLMKPDFLSSIEGLDKDIGIVISKIKQVVEDPTPDGKFKKHLLHVKGGKFYRARAGNYRIIYCFDSHCVYLLKLERRNEATYKGDIKDYDDDTLDADVLSHLADDEPIDTPLSQSNQFHWDINNSNQSKPLPEPITVELLNRLHVPPAFHARLMRITDQDALLACPGVPDDILLKIDRYMFETPLDYVMEQPDLVVNQVDDFVRYKEGELLTFLLKLSPEQERYAHWSLTTTGPTLVKGGPGTGKSTVALYRIRSLIEQLHAQEQPKILFTTYTNALIRSSEQLLEQLLGDKVRYVTVQTADKIATDVLREKKQLKDIIDQNELQQFLRKAIDETPMEGNALQKLAQKQMLERIGLDYLQQEITGVIIARQLPHLDAYLATSRAGRQVRLGAAQRKLLWHIYERLCNLLQQSGKETWQQRRARAAELVDQSSFFRAFDAVVVDEAQDLDPSVLRMLVKLGKATNRLFVTADANQSIYGSGFTWTDVHESLKFQGRTSILRANYRSTKEIGEATESYLADGILDPERVEPQYIHSGPLPVVRSVAHSQQEAELLVNYLRQTAKELRLTIGSCAILCPNKRAGREIAQTLKYYGLEATYMESNDLDLKRSGIKVLTLNASKGLEFPIVALAGFVGTSNYPVIAATATPDERSEILAKERRTIYVGMTRAMRALLVILPQNSINPLFKGFDSKYWNTN